MCTNGVQTILEGIELIQEPAYCHLALTSNNLNFKETLFDNGPFVAASSDFFTNTKDSQCDVTSCTIKQLGCTRPYQGDDLKIKDKTQLHLS